MFSSVIQDMSNLSQNELRPHSIDHYIQNPESNNRFAVNHPHTIRSIIDEKVTSPWSQLNLDKGYELNVLERYWEIQIKCHGWFQRKVGTYWMCLI